MTVGKFPEAGSTMEVADCCLLCGLDVKMFQSEARTNSQKQIEVSRTEIRNSLYPKDSRFIRQ